MIGDKMKINKVYRCDREIDVLYVLSANRSGQIVMRTFADGIKTTKLITTEYISNCENDDINSAIKEIQANIEAATIDLATQKRHIDYFGKVLVSGSHSGSLIKKSGSNKVNFNKYNILKRHYAINGIDKNDKVSDVITLVRK
jgi:hypothetical protein